MFKPKDQQTWRPCYALASEGRFTGEVVCGPSNGWMHAYDWMSDYVTIKNMEPPIKSKGDAQMEYDSIATFEYPITRKGWFCWWNNRPDTIRKEFDDNVIKTYRQVTKLEGGLTIKMIECPDPFAAASFIYSDF